MGDEGEAQVPNLRMNCCLDTPLVGGVRLNGCLDTPLGAGGENERLLGLPFRGRG